MTRWLRSALDRGVDPAVIAFLCYRPSALLPHYFLWDVVSDVLGQRLPAEVEYAAIEDALGAQAAAEFSSFLLLYRHWPSVQDALEEIN